MYNANDIQRIRIPALKSLLATDSKWAIRGLLAVYALQTEEEKVAEGVTENNGVGFTSSDGEILTSFAKQVEQGRNMSPKQMAMIHKKLPKYARQLDRIVQSKR